MTKFYVRATDGAVPSVKFEFLYYYKIEINTDEMNSHTDPLKRLHNDYHQ